MDGNIVIPMARSFVERPSVDLGLGRVGLLTQPAYFSLEEDEEKGEHEQIELDNRFIAKEGHENDASVLYLLALTCGVGGLQVVWSVVLSNGTPYLISLGLSKSLTALVWMAAPLCGVFVQPIMGTLSDRSRSSWGRRRTFLTAGTGAAVISMIALAWIEEIVLTICSDLQNRDLQRALVIVAAVLLVYTLNIAIQPIQVSIRALVIENCPAHQQTHASAYASYLTSVGNIIGYTSGLIGLPKLWYLSRVTHFQGLSLVAILALVITVIITCFSVNENDPRSLPLRPGERHTDPAALLSQLICTFKTMPIRIRKVCQIQFCAWMGWFPFLYYATTYVSELYISPYLAGNSTAPSIAREVATKNGTLAVLLFACVTLFANITFSIVLRYIDKNRKVSNTSTSIISRAWTCAHIFFAISTFATVFVTSSIGGIVLIALIGIPWAMTLWAPFAIIGKEVAAMHHTDGIEDQTGAIMSLHNVAISTPQIAAALLSCGVLWISQRLGSDDSTGWTLRVGACATLLAAYLTIKLEDD